MALMPVQKWTRFERALKAAETATQGAVAAIDLTDGALVVGAVDENLFPIGRFEDDLVGDGTKVAKVRLFAEVEIVPMTNSATGPVDDGDVGAMCYLRANNEVSMTATGSSVFGRVWGISGSGAGATVYVQPAMTLGPQGPQGEPGA